MLGALKGRIVNAQQSMTGRRQNKKAPHNSKRVSSQITTEANCKRMTGSFNIDVSRAVALSRDEDDESILLTDGEWIRSQEDDKLTDVYATWKDAFNVVDVHNTGVIEKEELNSLVIALGWAHTSQGVKEEVEALMELLDERHDGVIEFDEFMTLTEKVGVSPEEVIDTAKLTEKWKVAFDAVDIKQTGYIDHTEMKTFIRALGWLVNESHVTREADWYISVLDNGKNGVIDFVEFQQITHKLGIDISVIDALDRETLVEINHKYYNA